ncbi:hypothetical protein LX99_03793 [Mucilaginibacter oryzae]|uniref:SprT-like family protein n=1 Tax=Mucilaginibacter oryzae TaxID=468058 RepID=A0A316H5J5_9SPHI|nr:hypothetical protein [Mucilaginibacter oryzae]PWK75300.1 hypothetical protein LX99_03793 [Mucilaginibacter oryzae]
MLFTVNFDTGGGSGSGSGSSSGNGGAGGGSGTSTSPDATSLPPCDQATPSMESTRIVLNGNTSGGHTPTDPYNPTNPTGPTNPNDPNPGFPPPDDPGPTVSPCYVVNTMPLTIKTDSLSKHFPCATKLIIEKLAAIGVYANLVTPFLTTQRPDIIWQDGSLPWAASIPNSTEKSYKLGETQPLSSGIGQSAVVTLNRQMLLHSSKLLIAAAIIHETMHAYINYGLSTAQDDASQGYVNFSKDNWLLPIDQWCTIDGLPSNYSNHLVMLTSYFDQAVTALKTWDNASHTDEQYAMAILYGLNTSDPTAPATQISNLQQAFDAIKKKYSLTETQLNTFYLNSLNSNDKLSGNCN